MKWFGTLIACLISATTLAQGYDKVEKREKVDFENIHKSTVLFTFGQSNSANHGQWSHLYTPVHEVYNYFQGNLYKAKDPFLGATGEGGSVWGIVADGLIDKKLAERVTVVPIGVGGVEIGAWAKGGNLHELLCSTVRQLVEKKVHVDYICWHQGESDNIRNTSTEEYISQFLTIREVFRSNGIDAPIIVAVASYHPDCIDENFGCSDDIRNAQIRLAEEYDDIYLGPDTDQLNQLYQRADGVHFSYLGQKEHARLWVESVLRIKK